MATLSIDYSEKLRLLRKSEGLTQQEFSDITGLGLSTIKKYETGQKIAGIASVERVINVDQYKKYTMWILLDEVSPASGQVAPQTTNAESDRNSKRIG